MNDSVEVYHKTLTEWDEFRKWCEDRRGPAVVAKDLTLFVELFRETQDRMRHQQLLQSLGTCAAKDGAAQLAIRDGVTGDGAINPLPSGSR
ncbi:MAG: hypothetical protein K0Q55_1035 [Verrucomicrobia bacterium]|jgi:hypothetical protein|nr:hypothetical protein [Verrucomicrobiota bacterium]